MITNRVLSAESENDFQNYVRKVIADFEVKKENFSNFEPKGFELIFMIKNLNCQYSLDYAQDNFYLKLSYEIDDDKNPNLRKKFYDCLRFLTINKGFLSRNENSIIIKSKLPKESLERAKIIFFVEKYINPYFFSETKVALEEIINEIFTEFKETMTNIWKTLYENFEMVDFSSIAALKFNNYNDTSNDDNAYQLPELIKINYDYCKSLALEKESHSETFPRRKRNWLRRIYIFIKYLKTN